MPQNRFSYQAEQNRPTPWGLALLTLLGTVFFFGVYAYFVMARNVNWLFWVYLGLLIAASLSYILYNRAFSDANCTYENLPYDWSDQKRRDFLRARDERKKKSKWLLLFIFPLSLTLMFDIIYLFFGDTLVNLFDAVGRGLGIW